MASFTESSLIFNNVNPEEPNNNNNNKFNWSNRVYLCLEDTKINYDNSSDSINGFKCYRYNSFKNASTAWDKDLTNYHKMNIRHTIIPICKWVPRIFDRFILDRKLKKYV